MLGPGLDRRRAERNTRLLEFGLADLVAEQVGTLTVEMTTGVRSGALTADQALIHAARIEALVTLQSRCERDRRLLMTPGGFPNGTPTPSPEPR